MAVKVSFACPRMLTRRVGKDQHGYLLEPLKTPQMSKQNMGVPVMQQRPVFHENRSQEMPQIGAQQQLLLSPNSIGRCLASCVLALLTQFSLALITRFFSTSPLLIQLSLSAVVVLVVLGFGGWCRRLFRVRASPPAFVFFTIAFIWSVYVAVIRQAVSLFMDLLFNGEIGLLIFGLCSIIRSDPGYVEHGDLSSTANSNATISNAEVLTENAVSVGRVRFCKICKAYVRGFDHHCPAFGNCIGQNNHFQFIVLLLGFLAAEVSFLLCSSLYSPKWGYLHQLNKERNLGLDLAVGANLFTVLQLLWQGIFLLWHIYCICVNIRTDEWVNWKSYGEFQLLVDCENGQSSSEMIFKNPYDKGIARNIEEFLASRA